MEGAGSNRLGAPVPDPEASLTSGRACRSPVSCREAARSSAAGLGREENPARAGWEGEKQ